MSHAHRMHKVTVRPFSGPVSKYVNEAAHGNVTEEHTCTCGATRKVNVNGRHIERGPWQEPSQPVARLRLVRREVPR
mgnify:CR=1 FL=1